VVHCLLLVTLALTACAQSAPGRTGPEAAPGTIAATDSRPLVVFVRVEPATLATRAFVQKSAGLFFPWRLVNALPALTDAHGLPQPELLSILPALNSESWQVFPDGTMRTSYTLRSNLTWHDGQPLTAADFAFAWRVYAHPELGLAGQAPMPAIAYVAAIDRDRFVIHWKSLYPDADSLSAIDRELPALPQHILGTAFEQMATAGRDPLVTHPFWAAQYVGLGPYRLQQQEPGSFMDLVRFEGYALGVPRIPRIQLRFSDDQNVVVAHVLAGEAHAATDSSIGQAGAQTLAQEWARNRGGVVFNLPSSWRYLGFQLRPELANPRAILDPRVRKAIAHAVDKQAVGEAAYFGQAIITDTPVWTGSAWGEALDDSIPTYPLDPRATERLMTQAGFSKGGDSIYRGADGRLALELTSTDGPTTAAEMLVMAYGLQAAGFEIQQRIIPAAQAQDGQMRATFPAMQNISTLMGEHGVQTLASTHIPSDSNRWIGGNRGAWSSPEYDRLLHAFNSSLSRADRVEIMRRMMRIYSEELPRVSLYFPANAFVHVAGLQGPTVVAPESRVAWNVHQWEFK
jgi:peptide/nickel transport system substrate-binding protein